MTDRMISLAFAIAVCVAVAVPQVTTGPARIVVGLVYMLAGLTLAAPYVPRPRLAWHSARPGRQPWKPLSGPQSGREVR